VATSISTRLSSTSPRGVRSQASRCLTRPVTPDGLHLVRRSSVVGLQRFSSSTDDGTSAEQARETRNLLATDAVVDHARLLWAHGSRAAQVRHRRVRYVVERVVGREDEGVGGGTSAEVPPGLGTARAEANDALPARLLNARSAVLGKEHWRRRGGQDVWTLPAQPEPAMFAPVRSGFAQTACLQSLRPKKRTRTHASERRTLPFLPRIEPLFAADSSPHA
jgi:hypothetical protein